MRAYYNEWDAYPAQWIRNLVAAGHVALGEVDERSIKEVQPNEVGNGQVHLFAGIAVWSYALRLAGWPDEFPVWTASCPCQPFSAAGRGKGTADERHLWPEAFRLVNARRPAVVVGEQVASKDGLAWLDLVHADMEGAGYAFRAVDFCAAGVGAPHIRQRLYWAAVRLDGLAHHHQQGFRQLGSVVPEDGHAQSGTDVDGRGEAERVANDGSEGRKQIGAHGGGGGERGGAQGLDERPRDGNTISRGLGYSDSQHAGRDARASALSERGAGLRPVADESRAPSATERLGDAGDARPQGLSGHVNHGNQPGREREKSPRPTPATGPTNGAWSDVIWLPCRDGKSRPTQPGLFPLAYGTSGRMVVVRSREPSGAEIQKERWYSRIGALKAFGNGLVAPQAAEFLRALKPLVLP